MKNCSLPLATLLALLAGPVAALDSPKPDTWSGAYARAGGNRSGGQGHSAATAEVGGAYTSAAATASAEFGTLKASAWSNEEDNGGQCSKVAPWCKWGTSAQAAFYDTLIFRRESGDPDRAIPFKFNIDGDKYLGRWWGEASATAHWYFGTDERGWLQPNSLYLDEANKINGSISMVGDYMVLFFYASLSVSAGQGGAADYSHTMQFEWEQPEGWSLQSWSGNFMTGRAAPVPEPQSWALLLAGLAGAGFLARRRSGSAA